MLKLHSDTHLYTVIVALNDDFEGGGLFYYKSDDSHVTEGDPTPDLPPELTSYDSLEEITGRSTSVVVNPVAKTGSVLIHNFTLAHAVAPIEKGTRYSLIFCYDMHHPALERFFPEEFEVMVKNDYDFPIDIHFLEPDEGGKTLRMLEEGFDEKEFTFISTTGSRFEVTNTNTGELVQTFSVPEDKVNGEGYHVHLLAQEDDDESSGTEVSGHLKRRHPLPIEYSILMLTTCLDTQSEDDITAKIVNNFPYPVSLVWRGRTPEDVCGRLLWMIFLRRMYGI